MPERNGPGTPRELRTSDPGRACAPLDSGPMGETIDQVVERLRKLAVELVRTHRLSDAAAVLAGVGAVELMDMFAAPEPAKPVEPNGGPNGGGQHRAPEFDQS